LDTESESGVMNMGNEATRDTVRRRTACEHFRHVRRSWGRRRRARRLNSIASAALGMLIGGCIYDADDRCDSGQVLYAPDRCVCAEGSALTAQGCVPCGENEVVGPEGCVCGEGFSRPMAEDACQAAPSGLGTACDSASTPCADPKYDLCFATSGSAGYCTNACQSSDECDGGYACDTAAAPTYCRRPPSGAGQACTTAADCAGTEATFCESFMLHECVVRDCSPTAQDCFPGKQCCDLSQFGVPAPICLPNGAC
jgi:hypothetical protein